MAEIYLTKVRLSFPKLVEATASKDFPNAGKRFGADFLLEQNHPDFAKFMGEVGKIASDKWKEAAGPTLNLIQQDRRLRCYGIGNEKVDKKTYKPYVGYEGMAYISAAAPEDKPPLMVLPDGSVCDNTNTMQRQQLARKLYGGCYVNVAIRPWVQDNQFGRGIRCELLGVQFCADGEPFGEAPPDLNGKFHAVQGAEPNAPAAPMPGFPAFFQQS